MMNTQFLRLARAILARLFTLNIFYLLPLTEEIYFERLQFSLVKIHYELCLCSLCTEFMLACSLLNMYTPFFRASNPNTQYLFRRSLQPSVPITLLHLSFEILGSNPVTIAGCHSSVMIVFLFDAVKCLHLKQRC
jgi:hypothetical protein